MADELVGTNLKPMRGAVARKFGQSMNAFLKLIQDIGSKTVYPDSPAMKLFVKAGVPATNTEADSPGSDLCYIWDSTNSDLYFVHGWSAVGTFTVLKVID